MDNNTLQHYGIPGMKWGKRKINTYRSTSIKSAMSRRANEKVDKSFKKWNENSRKLDDAIELGKKANLAKISYESDRSNKQLKREYKEANKQYTKALAANTTYRKGVIRREVGKDASRKYLSAAKRIKKQLDNSPQDITLNKQYTRLMNQHDIERAKARRAVEVGSKRSAKKASIKRAMTNTIKATTATAAVAAGAYSVNRYLDNHDVRLNGRRVRFSAQNMRDIADGAKKIKDFLGFLY